MTIMQLILVACGVAAGCAGMLIALRWRRPPPNGRQDLVIPPPPVAKQFLRVAGRIVDPDDWSPEILEQVRKDYFRPSATTGAVVVVDLTSTCPLRHLTRERVAVIARDIHISDAIATALPRLRAALNCTECGKLGKLTAKSVAWKGSVTQWDGSI